MPIMVWNPLHLDCLLNSLFKLTTKKTPKPCIMGPVSNEFLSKKNNTPEKFSSHDNIMNMLVG